MKRLVESSAWRKTLVLALVLGWGVLGVTAISSSAAGDGEEDNLRALVPQIVATWGTMDIAKIAPHYATDEDFAYFDIAPMKYNNFAEYREGVQKAFFDPNKSISATVSDVRVHRRGTLAWATFLVKLDIVSKQDSASQLNARWTMVLEKRGKDWIVVHEHVSAPLGG